MLTSTMRSHSSTFSEAMSESDMTPALPTMTSTRPQACRAGLGEGGDVGAVGDVQPAGQRLTAICLDFFREHFQPIGAPRAEHELRAGGAELAGNACAYAARRAAYENDLVHHCLPFVDFQPPSGDCTKGNSGSL